MKKIVIIITAFFALLTTQAQNVQVLKQSDTISLKKIIVPDSVFNTAFNQNDVKLAIIKGEHIIFDKTLYEYKGFKLLKKTKKVTLVYKKNQKVFEKTQESIIYERFAWITFFLVMLYFAIVKFFLLRTDADADADADAAAVAVAVDDISSKKINVTYNIIITIGMAIIWYYFTPLFFLASMGGIVLGYLMAYVKK